MSAGHSAGPFRITGDGGDWSASHDGLGTSVYQAIRDADFNAVASDFTKGNPARFDADGTYDREAGLIRRAEARSAYLARQDRLAKALQIIKQDVHKESDLIRLLHCASHSLNEQKPLPTTDLAESIKWMEQLADRIQFRNDPMVDCGVDGE